MKDIIIRKAKIKDLDDILRLEYKLFKEIHKKYDKSFNLGWPLSEKGKKYFKDRITKVSGFSEVAEYDGNVIGFLSCSLYKQLFYRKEAKCAWLEDVFIEKKFSGRGIGRNLVKHFIKWCKDKKVRNIFVTTNAKNSKALTFYKKSGFKDYEITLEIKL